MRRDIPPNWSVDVVACRPLSTGNSLRPALINRLQSMSLVSTIKCTAKRHLFLSLNLKFRKLNVFNVEMVETFGRAPLNLNESSSWLIDIISVSTMMINSSITGDLDQWWIGGTRSIIHQVDAEMTRPRITHLHTEFIFQKWKEFFHSFFQSIQI